MTTRIEPGFNDSGELVFINLNGKKYSAQSSYILIPISELQNISLNEIPNGVNIFPVKKISEDSQDVELLDLNLMEILLSNSGLILQIGQFSRRWNSILSLPYYMDLLVESIRKYRAIDSTVFVQDTGIDEDLEYHWVNIRIMIKEEMMIQEVMEKAENALIRIDSVINNFLSSLKIMIDNWKSPSNDELKTAWNLVHTTTESNEKGKSLELFTSLLFSCVEGFYSTHSVKTETEEIDITIRNESKDAFWTKFTPFILVECKNWSSKCGKNEIVLFNEKLRNRYGTSDLGFLVSINGFTSTVKKEILRGSREDIVIVLISGKDLFQILNDSDRNECFKTFVTESVFK